VHIESVNSGDDQVLEFGTIPIIADNAGNVKVLCESVSFMLPVVFSVLQTIFFCFAVNDQRPVCTSM